LPLHLILVDLSTYYGSILSSTWMLCSCLTP
jgi:hypothetical protein